MAIHAVGKHEGVHYIAQELVPGGRSLVDWLDDRRKGGELPRGYFREVAGIMIQVAEALEHTHASGVIHRDVKPSNILMTPEGRAKVTDFGLARVEDALALSRTGDFSGTPFYMSPEQAASRRIGIDHRTDIFSLGVTLYEMLTLERPFQGETSQEVLRKILLHDPRDPRKANPCVPRDLAVICLKAMEKRPEERYGSMREFADDLGRFLSGDVIRARKAGVAARGMRIVRRNPILSGAVGVAMLALVSLVLYVLWSYPQVIEERNRAREAEKAEKLAKKRLILERDAKDRAYNRAEGMRLAARSSLLRASDPTLVLLLAIESARRSPGLIANWFLVQALDSCREHRTLGHAFNVESIRFSPDSKRVVTASYDRTAVIWDVLTGKPLVRLRGHEGAVESACFSPDGKRVVTASHDRTARIWDASNGALITTLRGHEDWVYTAIFSPDGKKVVTTSLRDRTARLWDATTGKELATLAGHGDRVERAFFSPDGNRVVTASSDRTARIWEVATGRCAVTLDGHAGRVPYACFSPDGRRVATVSRAGTIWSVETGKRMVSLNGHGSMIYTIDFAPDGKSLVTASQDNTARIWDAKSGKEIARFTHDLVVTSACFSPDGQHVVTSSWDNTSRVWNVRTGREIMVLRRGGGAGDAHFSPDGQWIATTGRDSTASLWYAFRQQKLIEIQAHEEPVLSLAFDPEGKRLVTAGDHIARIWNVGTGQELARLRGHGGDVTSVCFSPDGKRVLTASTDGSARIWNPESGEELHKVKGFGQAALAAQFSPDGKTVITSDCMRRVPGREGHYHSGIPFAKIWNAITGKVVTTLSAHGHIIIDASFSPDGRRVVAGSADGIAYVWDAGTGEELVRFEDHFSSDVKNLQFSPDGKRVISAGHYFFKIWTADTGQEVAAIRAPSAPAWKARFGPDGKRIVAESWGSATIFAWSPENGERLHGFRGHVSRINSAVFSPEGAKLLTVSDDRTARVWDTATGKEIDRLLGHTEPVWTGCFSPDGETVATGSIDGTVRIWPLDLFAAATRQAPRKLTPSEKIEFEVWDRGEREAHEVLEKSSLTLEAIARLEQNEALDAGTRKAALGFVQDRSEIMRSSTARPGMWSRLPGKRQSCTGSPCAR